MPTDKVFDGFWKTRERVENLFGHLFLPFLRVILEPASLDNEGKCLFSVAIYG